LKNIFLKIRITTFRPIQFCESYSKEVELFIVSLEKFYQVYSPLCVTYPASKMNVFVIITFLDTSTSWLQKVVSDIVLRSIYDVLLPGHLVIVL